MKMSLKWIQEFVDVADYFQKPQELADLLTRAGLEVKEIQDRRKDFQNVVVGLILEKDKHPQADRLSKCMVSTGEGVVHQIVCGAQNHKSGDHVVVALPGAVLPGNFAIKQSQIRGVDSAGMLCSLKELGLATESEGIYILPKEAQVGMPFATYSGLDDIIFELKVTPNRADCLSHLGLAREISCLASRPLKNIEMLFKTQGLGKSISVKISASELCSRYSGRLVGPVKVQASPDWLKKRIESVGLKSINNIVDVTNYVMMELGQPLHAFDFSKIKGAQIDVCLSQAGEKFVTLDGTELKLTGDELTIRDSSGALALAGVVGGKDSGVNPETEYIFIESAHFSASSVRKTSRRFGVTTDSCYRFSRGVDASSTRLALDRATDLVLQLAGGQAHVDVVDVMKAEFVRKSTSLSFAELSERLGYAADKTKFEDYLKRIGCTFKVDEQQIYHIQAPTYRFDLEQSVDYVEEYARLHGYEHIPETLPALSSSPTPHQAEWTMFNSLHRLVQASGATQALNFSFVSEQKQNDFVGDWGRLKAIGLAQGTPTRLKNPLSEDLNVMRSLLSYGLYLNVVTNIKYGVKQGSLYELGTVFSQTADGVFHEHSRIALASWGRSDVWQGNHKNYPVVYDLKSQVEEILAFLKIKNYTWMTLTQDSAPLFCHPGQSVALIAEGQKVGFIGSLHPQCLQQEKLREPVALAELDLQALLKGQPRPVKSTLPVRFPIIERDFSFVVSKDSKMSDLIKGIQKITGALMLDCRVFDIFEGERLGAGKKSVSLRLSLQDKNGTLQDDQVQKIQDQILALAQSLTTDVTDAR